MKMTWILKHILNLMSVRLLQFEENEEKKCNLSPVVKLPFGLSKIFYRLVTGYLQFYADVNCNKTVLCLCMHWCVYFNFSIKCPWNEVQHRKFGDNPKLALQLLVTNAPKRLIETVPILQCLVCNHLLYGDCGKSSQLIHTGIQF